MVDTGVSPANTGYSDVAGLECIKVYHFFLVVIFICQHQVTGMPVDTGAMIPFCRLWSKSALI